MRSTHEMYQLAAKYRGNVLNQVTWMEKFMDAYIARFFTSDPVKITAMHLLFLGDNRISFEGKKQVFDFIGKNHDTEWYDNYKSTRLNSEKKYSPYGLGSDLDFIKERRNMLAHRIVDTSDEGRLKEDKIGFIIYKNTEQTHDFTENDYGQLMFVIKDITNYIYNRVYPKK